jgi:cellobiose transport system permease protein
MASTQVRTTAAVRARPTLRSRMYRADEKVAPYLLISPFFLIFAVFGVFPLLYTAYVSLTNRELLSAEWDFVGLANYRELLGDDYFWNAVENTLGIFVLSTVPQLVLALGIAHLLNRSTRVRTLFRMSVLLPQVTSLVAVALIFTDLFARDYGLVNYVIGQLGFGAVDWEAGRLSSWIALSVMITWRWTGYNALIYLAAMQSIPDELYEAAEIDGASRWQQFRYVTLPQLRPTIVFTVIVSTIGGLQVFTEPFLFESNPGVATGGAGRQFQTVTMYLYEKAFAGGQFDFGYAAAIAWCLFALIVVVSIVDFLVIRRIRTEED